MRSVVTWLAFCRVPPFPVLAPTSSAQSMGKVNANTGWLAFTYFSFSSPCTLHSFTISPASHWRVCRGQKSPIRTCFDFISCSRTLQHSRTMLTQRFEPHSSIWGGSRNLCSFGTIRQIHYFVHVPCFFLSHWGHCWWLAVSIALLTTHSSLATLLVHPERSQLALCTLLIFRHSMKIIHENHRELCTNWFSVGGGRWIQVLKLNNNRFDFCNDKTKQLHCV